VKETKEVFPGSEQQPSSPPPEPEPKASEPQTKKIWVELHRIGRKDEDHVRTIQMLLGLPDLKSMKDLTKSQARTVIDRLIKVEAKK
jgi:hypothetical protein